MQSYNYRAYDAKGKIVKGVLEADSERHLRARLREQKMTPVQVSLVGAASALFQFRRKVNGNDLMLVTRQLATLLGSGMSLEESLRLMAEQAENVQIKRLVSSVRSKLSEGHSLSGSMQKSPASFPPDYIATISAGEETGHLTEVLERLADEVEQSGKARQSLKAALIYPALMLTVALSVVVLLLVYVVPQVTRVFSQMNQELPALTQALLTLSNWLQMYGGYLFMAVVGSVLIFLLMLRNIENRKKWDRFLLGVPRLKYWIVTSNSAGWSRSLGMLLSSGVPMLESLKIAGERIGNLALRESLEDVSDSVREGDGLFKALLKTGDFPPFLIHMISSGESSGALDKMLIKVADYYDQRIQTMINTALKLFEPLLVIIMGGVVLLIVMAVLVPVIQMNQLI